MEIKRHIPEITAAGIATVVAKEAIGGNPQTVKEFANFFVAANYAGVPAAIIVHAARGAYAWYKNLPQNKK